MTNSEKILKYLERNGATGKRELMLKFQWEANPDTISRACRKLAEDGLIEKVQTKFTTYKLKDDGRLL